MIDSNRKYIDPSAVLNELTNQGIQFGRQQDVSEFHDLFLKKIESDFKGGQYDLSKLFYGKLKTHLEYMENGTPKTNEKETPFSNLIVNVSQECHDLYSSLDSYTKEEKVEYNKENATQSHWISSLPTVIMFQLQRIQFSKEKKTATKIQLPFTFDKEIYLDRYLDEHRGETLELRKAQEALQAELDRKVWELHSVMNHNGRGVSQIDLLQLTSELIDNDTVKTYLETIASKIDDKIKTIKVAIEQDRKKLATLYPKKSPYLLHSILVHDGDGIDSGHYYSYLYKEGQWLRCNDESIMHVEADDVYKKSLKSAYCLVYYDANASWRFDNYKKWIPHNLREEVNNDNLAVLQRNKEIEKDKNDKQLVVCHQGSYDPVRHDDNTPNTAVLSPIWSPKPVLTDFEINEIPKLIDQEVDELVASQNYEDLFVFLCHCRETYALRVALFQKVIQRHFSAIAHNHEEIFRVSKKLGFSANRDAQLRLEKIRGDFEQMIRFFHEGLLCLERNEVYLACDYLRNAIVYHVNLPTRFQIEFDVPEFAFLAIQGCKSELIARLKNNKCHNQDMDKFYDVFSCFFKRNDNYLDILQQICSLDELEHFPTYLAMFTQLQEGTNNQMVAVAFPNSPSLKLMIEESLTLESKLRKSFNDKYK